MATRRMPKISAEEKAAITGAARELAAELNEQKKQMRALKRELAVEKKKKTGVVKRASYSQEAKNRKRERDKQRIVRNGHAEERKCKGLNLIGKPCQLSPLIPERWDGPEEITGDYCLHHEPNVDRESRLSFQLTGSATRKAYRRVTPGEIAHELMQSAPHLFLRPYLKALGLEMDETTKEIRQVGQGLKLHGFSRGGEVIRSPYPDYTGQVQVAEKLLDRVYGKARQAVDLAAQNTTVSVNLTMDESRIEKVAQVLQQAGALPLPNGNGNGDHAEVIDAEAVELPMEEIE